MLTNCRPKQGLEDNSIMRVADEQISSFQSHKEAGKRKQTRAGRRQADANNNSSGGHDEDIKEDHEGRP